MKKLLILFLSFAMIACTAKKQSTTDEVVVKHRNVAAAKLNVQLGLAYYKQGHLERSKARLLTAYQQAPRLALTNGALAYYLENTGETKKANTYYKRALNFAPNEGGPLNNYGAFLCRQGNYEEANRYFMQAVKDIDYVNSAEAYENAGLCAMKNNKPKKAVEYFDLAVQQNPNRVLSLFELANASYKKADFKKAKFYSERVMNISPDNAGAIWQAYKIAVKLNDSKDAYKYESMLATKFPKSPEYKHLVMRELS